MAMNGVVAAIINVEPMSAEDSVDLAVVLFRYDPVSFEVTEIIDSYSEQGDGANWLEADRINGMLEMPEVLIAHSAEYAQSFVCRLSEAARSKRWKCSHREISWKRFGAGTTELGSLLKHFQVQAENNAFGLLQLLRLKSPDGRSYLAHLVQERELTN
jgi:DNA polymerase-3 subunit epsilon